MVKVKLSSMKSSSGFKIGFFCCFLSLGVIIFLMGIVGMTGADIVQFNGTYVYGFSAIITAIFIAVFISIFSGLFAFLGLLFLRFLGKFMSFGMIEFDADLSHVEVNQQTEILTNEQVKEHA